MSGARVSRRGGSGEGRRPPLAPFNDLELAQMQRLVFEGWELHHGGSGGGYVYDAAAAFEDWYWTVLPDRAARAGRRRRAS